jgi:glycosyltransferase involved in cell wall biosynthesis
MSKKITFSIISPTYNCQNYILNSFKSLCCQTEENWEWIVVDDGSTDDSLEILKSIEDERVRFFTYPNNKGRGHARNLALSKVSGDIVVVWDIDDLYFPDRLSKIKKAFLDENVDYFCSYAVIVDNNLNVKGARYFGSELLLKKSFVHPTLAFRASLLNVLKYGEGMIIGEDLMVMVYLNQKCNGYFCKEFLMLYLEDREVNLNKTLDFHRNSIRTTTALIKSNILPMSIKNRILFFIKSSIKSILLNAMRIAPSIYLKTVKYRQLQQLALKDLSQEKQDFIDLFKSKSF